MSTQGIQELMSAENRASQIVAEARAARGERMKEAKREAETVIAKLRSEKQAEFEASSQASQTQDEFAELKKNSEAEIADMKKLYNQNKGAVTNMMVKTVTDVDLSLSDTRILAGKRASGQA
mmetsp:Transcript_6918/g.9684  ORF Transcript_6918/g.9684 Transcript_6918/m.9684 type:complete len:122 (-) Transcript_6918:119-484(-)|eukprot:CAMPEP_0197291186 /NCGR_PEP_ID=MMETSP0890-20130614/11736_1 /TAXON_ID=44058 ORGANISM="Aureoumbra lagunensis, Strain CCMP1510" /NCGR_SAMPLE_ID=MMETSP0890 /ASSEMBLY_ACC=CAM_ASM_000533 /LENGTH=121 /DNA_ID=CAMNT_0042763819 /DNA_START=70 /DNA_END=435 /DNA_ORIENTATION=-